MSDTGDESERRSYRSAGSNEEPSILVLGPCAVRIVGEPVAASDVSDVDRVELSLVQRTILARLAIARPGSVGLEELIDTIWGEDPPATARTSIHNQISRIRTRLGTESVLTDGGRYSLTLRSDVEVVTKLLKVVERSLTEKRFVEATVSADTALGYWRGMAFDELGELDEARYERRRLSEVHRSLETLRLGAAIGAGWAAWAIPEAERLVAETPTDEHRWVLLVRSLELAGRRGDALGAYERARRVLVDQLGLEPGAVLRAAESSVLGEISDNQRISGQSPLVGRSELIAAALARFDEGKPVILIGEPGIGKTRLLTELWRRLRRRGLPVARSACSVHPQTAVVTLAELCDDLGTPLDPALPPASAFMASIDAALEPSDGLVLAVDDLDLAGPTTLLALEVAASLDGVGLIATVEDTVTLPASLIDGALSVPELSDLELTQLVKFRVDGDEPLEPETLAWLIEMSGGNPAFLEYLLDNPLWRERHDLIESGSPDDSAPPHELHEVVHRRLDRLGSTTRGTLEVAAVCGPTFPLGLLLELTPERGIAGGVAASLLVEVEDDKDRAWISFRHGAIQRILYNDISPGRRMEIHNRAAALLRSAQAPPETVAWHALGSAEVDPKAAIRDTFAAAVAASEHGAHADAAQWYAKALDVVTRTGSVERLKVEALVGHGNALRLAGSADQEDALFDAAEAAFILGDTDLIGTAAFAVLQLGSTTESGNSHERAIEVAEKALKLVSEPDHRALVAAGASLAHSMSGDTELCRNLFLQAEVDAQSPAVRRHVLPFAYLALGHPRDFAMRERVTDELSILASESDDPVALFEAMQLAFSVGLVRCDGDQVRNAVAESAKLIERVGDVGRRWSLAYQMSAVAHIDGDLDLAEKLAEQALEIFGAVSPSRAFAAYGGQLLMIRLAQGRLAELADTLEELVVDQPGVPAWHAALALILVPDNADRAEHHARTALDDVAEDFTWLPAHLLGGRAAALAGDAVTRNRYIERLTPLSGYGGWQGTCSYGPVDTVLWQLHAAESETNPEAEGLAEFHRTEARSCAQRLGSPTFEAELQ